ncbi:hypothetical protein QEH59_16715, partial [Coraliomargarita sp. SDUM461004]
MITPAYWLGWLLLIGIGIGGGVGFRVRVSASALVGLGSAGFINEAPAMLVCVKNVEAVSWFLHIKVWFLLV